MEADGSTTPLAESYRGRRLNSPNDVVVASDGGVWFTDPPYGITVSGHGHLAEPELEASYVFRVDGTGGEPRIATDALAEPNGLACVRLGAPRLFARVASGVADGLRVRGDGCVFSSCGAAVEVFDPIGRRLDLVEVPEVVSNCAFFGRRLFITGVTSLYAVDVG